MNKKIVGILVCLLFFGVCFCPSITGYDKDVEKTNYIKNETLNVKNEDYNNVIQQIIENGVISNNNWSEQDKITALDSEAGDWFGVSVSIYSDYAIIGAHADDGYRGSSYVFKRSGTTWTEEQKLTASDSGLGDRFGMSVSTNGDYAIIGAHGDDGYRGSAYVFKRSGSTWIQQAKLLASDGVAEDNFGYSVFIDDDYALVGAYCDDSDRGSAYVFKRSGTTWTEVQKLTASDGEAGDLFSLTISIDGDYAIIGAHGDDNFLGSAYIFKSDGTSWTEEQKLTASDGVVGDWFGRSVSISGDYAIVGAIYNNDYLGSAYVFKRSGTSWMWEAKLVASDGEYGDAFGICVSINGDNAIIGAFFDDDWTGSAYVFRRSDTSWIQEDKLIASDGETSDWFGVAVSIYGDYAIIGAPADDVLKGSAYVFNRINHPPTAPTIDGPASGKAGEKYEYTFVSTDYEGHYISYFINWGDGSFSGWLGPYAPEEPCNAYHAWWKEKFIIRVKARDTVGSESNWTELVVTMPRNRLLTSTLFIQFLERFPNTFPILRQILGL